MLEIVPAAGFFYAPLIQKRTAMMKQKSEEMSRTSQESPREERNAPSVTMGRERLARLLGRLLARHWLREKRLGKTQSENGREPVEIS